eukprot:TRINITY_DN33545_c0_g1_i1.p1 TRINITY_DN33545_c0_g1~~TRINITY_DN33545_c0_g1_i1.p1  ORF type:complete len:330 (+),score=51.20 TRINITY_DN33545_c0_g1_i1:49-990(+)
MASFIPKRSGVRQAQTSQLELNQHWSSLSIPRVCAVTATCDLGFAVVTYPLWHLKTRLQAGGPTSTIAAARELISQRGPSGLYRGAVFGTFGILPANIIYVLSYEWSKHYLSGHVSAAAAPAAAAVLAEGIFTLLASPVENVVVRMQCLPASAPHLRFGKSATEFGELWKAGGPLRLWRGGLLGLASNLPQATIWWLVYENSKSWLQKDKVGDGAATSVMDAGAHTSGCATAAVVASCVATLLTNPIDVVKVRAQSAPAAGHFSPLACFRSESLFVLFVRGLFPRLALAACAGLSESAVYEVTMHYGKAVMPS